MATKSDQSKPARLIMSVAELQLRTAKRGVETPLWLRVWHFLVALLFLPLVYSGVALTYSRAEFALMDYEFASLLHEVTGIAISVLYVAFVIVSLVTGYWRTYTRRMRGLPSRMGRFMRRMFGKGERQAEPEDSKQRRFEATTQYLLQLQQFLYLTAMAFVMPVLIVTGLLYLYPEKAPETIGELAGLWPLAVGHYVAGLLGTLFILLHIYISTIAGLRRIVFGR